MKSSWRIVPVILAAALLPACVHVKVDPIETKEIHIVHDVNIRVDQQLEDFFAFQEHAATQPATTQTVNVQGDAQ